MSKCFASLKTVFGRHYENIPTLQKVRDNEGDNG